MAIHGISAGAGESLAAAAFAVGVEAVHEHREHARLEKELGKSDSLERQQCLEAGRQKLKSAAVKAFGGAILSGGLQMLAGGCQLTGAVAGSKAWDAAGAMVGGASKAGDAWSAAGGFDQAAKVTLDKQAEIAQQGAQDAQQAHSAEDDATRRELGQLEDMLKTAQQTVIASVRA
ncbi:MAG TPA: hypothetical protein VGQ83_31735 [Polyangia bacterium]|jgi:hypothetical protein